MDLSAGVNQIRLHAKCRIKPRSAPATLPPTTTTRAAHGPAHTCRATRGGGREPTVSATAALAPGPRHRLNSSAGPPPRPPPVLSTRTRAIYDVCGAQLLKPSSRTNWMGVEEPSCRRASNAKHIKQKENQKFQDAARPQCHQKMFHAPLSPIFEHDGPHH